MFFPSLRIEVYELRRIHEFSVVNSVRRKEHQNLQYDISKQGSIFIFSFLAWLERTFDYLTLDTLRLGILLAIWCIDHG